MNEDDSNTDERRLVRPQENLLERFVVFECTNHRERSRIICDSWHIEHFSGGKVPELGVDHCGLTL